jgi:hypothetical protein
MSTPTKYRKLSQFWKHNINSITGYVINNQQDVRALKEDTKKYYVPEEKL